MQNNDGKSVKCFSKFSIHVISKSWLAYCVMSLTTDFFFAMEHFQKLTCYNCFYLRSGFTIVIYCPLLFEFAAHCEIIFLWTVTNLAPRLAFAPGTSLSWMYMENALYKYIIVIVISFSFQTTCVIVKIIFFLNRWGNQEISTVWKRNTYGALRLPRRGRQGNGIFPTNSGTTHVILQSLCLLGMIHCPVEGSLSYKFEVLIPMEVFAVLLLPVLISSAGTFRLYNVLVPFVFQLKKWTMFEVIYSAQFKLYESG